jgi:signal transduction histidine kinase
MLDPKTLSITIAFGNLLFAALASLYLASLPTRNRPLEIWRWAKAITAFGYLINLARTSLPFVPVVLGNQIQIVGFSLELAAYLMLVGRGHQVSRLGVAALLAIAALAVIQLSGAGSPIRLIFFSLCVSALLATMGIVLLSLRHNNPLARAISLFDLVGSLVMLVRAGYGFFLEPLLQFDPQAVNLAVYVFAFLLLIINGFGFLLLSKQDDDRKLQEALDKLTLKEAEQRRFIAMFSHEVRSPLAVIDATSQLLAAQHGLGDDMQRLIARIRRGASRLANFFDNSLTEDRVDSGKLTPQMVECDLAALAIWAGETGAILSEQHRVVVEVEPSLPLLIADQTLLRIILTNLISNAIKYSPAGTEIHLRFGRAGDNCRIEVADRGPGIPVDEMTVIFERYRRGRGAERVPGAGLGLSVVSDIIELHHGHIEVRNLPSGGASFIVSIPFRSESLA